MQVPLAWFAVIIDAGSHLRLYFAIYSFIGFSDAVTCLNMTTHTAETDTLNAGHQLCHYIADISAVMVDCDRPHPNIDRDWVKR
jgi:hypothetical protein